MIVKLNCRLSSTHITITIQSQVKVSIGHITITMYITGKGKYWTYYYHYVYHICQTFSLSFSSWLLMLN